LFKYRSGSLPISRASSLILALTNAGEEKASKIALAAHIAAVPFPWPKFMPQVTFVSRSITVKFQEAGGRKEALLGGRYCAVA